MAYNVGDKVRCTGNLATASGTPTNSTDVYGWVRNPSGTTTVYHYGVNTELVKSGVGVYYIDVDLSIVGHWYYGFYSTGTAQAASVDKTFYVERSKRG